MSQPDRRRGRPRVQRNEASVQVCLTVSSSQYRTLEAHARATRTTIPEAIRRLVARPRSGNSHM